MELDYVVDDEHITIFLDDDCVLIKGDDKIHSQHFDDITKNCDWYPTGYKIVDFFEPQEFSAVHLAMHELLVGLLTAEGVDTTNFSIEKYHQYVDDSLHAKIIAKTKRLYPNDFKIDIDSIVKKIESMVHEKLTFSDPVFNQEQWIIVRINRPGSTDFNPVHKDTYEPFDKEKTIHRIVNCWIPICGVDERNGLPMVPGSHLIPESKIQRTEFGSRVNGKNYAVNTIAYWGDNKLKRVAPKYGQALIFSSHLIHGLGKNVSSDTTRISFEFRVYA